MSKTEKTYRKYTTGLKLQLAAGALEKEQYRLIPKSNRARWKKLDAAGYWTPPTGAEIYDHESVPLVQALAEIQRLKKLLRAMAYLLVLYKTIVQLLPLETDQYLKIKPTVDTCMNLLQGNIPSNKFWKWMPFSQHQWAAWGSRKVCQTSLLNLCRHKHPGQLTTAEVTIIKDAANNTDHLHWPLASVYYQLMRDGLLHCSISCFYKYCRLLEITRPRRAKKSQCQVLQADAPLKMLHMDVTIFKTASGSKCYLHVIRDNFTKAILACKVAATNCSKDSMETLREVLLQNNLMEKEGTLITDDGAENKGELKDWLARAGMLWKQMIAQHDIIQSNSLVEAANKILKHQFLHHLYFETTEDLIAALPGILKAYNHRPALCLHGLTPQEVLDGKKPGKDLYAAKKITAQQLRIAANQKISCGKLASICMDSG